MCAATPAAYAQATNSVAIEQLNQDSVVVKKKPPVKKETPENAAPQRSIADDLKEVLEDYRISQLGRTNKALSNQYGGEPILTNEKPTAPAKPAAPKKENAPKKKVVKPETKDDADSLVNP